MWGNEKTNEAKQINQRKFNRSMCSIRNYKRKEQRGVNKRQFEYVMINGLQGEVEHSSEWITIREGKATGKLWVEIYHLQ